MIGRVGSITFSFTVTQVSGSTLTGGTWEADENSTLNISSAGSLTTNNAIVTLRGTGSTFNNINSLATNNGTFQVLDGRAFSTSGAFTNNGNLTLGGSLTVTGAFSQSAGGSLTTQLGGTAAGSFGALTSTQPATLDGAVSVELSNGFAPTTGQTFQVMSYPSRTGTFATITGLSIGGVAMFQANVAATSVVLTAVADGADLTPTVINIPSTGFVGDPVTVSYTVQNNESAPAFVSDWIDAIFLSTDTILDANDVLLGEVAHSGGLAGSASYSASLTTALPPAMPGDNFVLVSVDNNFLLPDSNRTNNVVATTGVMSVDMEALAPIGATFGTVASGEDLYFRLDEPAGSDLMLTLNVAIAGVAQLFARNGALPSATNFDFAATDTTALRQDVPILASEPGTYVVMVRGGTTAGTGEGFSITLRELGFEVVDSTPPTAPDFGTTNLSISGSHFTAQTTVILVAEDGSTLTPTNVQFQNSNSLLTDFDLTDVTPGVYDLELNDGNQTITFDRALQVTHAQTTHSGTINASEHWFGGLVHHVTGDVTVPNGVTLTIDPGAIVKFDAFLGMTVASGGQLIAQGTLAQPIIFTSVKDDAHGGDTNGNGDITAPAAGDWAVLTLGGTSTFDYVQMLYGGGSRHGNWSGTASIHVVASVNVTFSNSVMRDSFFDGILAWPGNVTVTNSVFTGIDRAISSHPGGNITITNSTFDDNRIGLLSHGGALTVSNSLVTNSITSGYQFDFGAVPTIRFTDIFSTVPGSVNYRNFSDQTGANGNISVDPSYKDPTDGNYRLRFVSPVIDAADGAIAPTTDFMGAPRYDDPRTTNTGTATGSGAFADLGAFEFVETADSDINLIVSTVTGPTAVLAGEPATVFWTVSNIGTGTAIGPWHDTINLILNPGPTETVIPVETVLVAAGTRLGPGQRLDFSAEITVPGALPGSYFWQVVPAATGDVFLGNNQGLGAGLAEVGTTLALNNLPVNGQSGTGELNESGQTLWYQVTSTSNEDLFISLSTQAISGDIELYAAQGFIPTPSDFQFKSRQFNVTNPTLVIPAPQAGVPYFIIAFGRIVSAPPTTFNLSASTIPFSVTGVSPSTVANGESVTVEITGGQLEADATYQLTGPGGVFTANSIFLGDSSTAYATFNLNSAAIGTYTVVVNKTGDTASLPGVLNVVAGTPGRFQISVTMPSAARVGRVFTAYLNYSNVGQADLVAPIVFVNSQNGALFTRDLSAQPSVTEESFLAAAEEGPAGILRPGQSVTVPVRVQAISGTTEIETSYIDASNDTPIAFAYVEDRVNSIEAGDPLLSTVLAAMESAIETWGDYVTTLASNATLLSRSVGDPTDLDRLLHLEYEKVKATLGSSISGTVTSPNSEVLLTGKRIQAVSTTDPSGIIGTAIVGYLLNDGSFVLPSVPAGTYTLEVQDAVVVSTTPGIITVATATPLTGVEIVVEPQVLVSGTVFDAQGIPVPGAVVAVLSDSVIVGMSIADDLGGYQLAGLTPDAYTFVTIADGNAQTIQNNVSVTQQFNLVNLILDPQASVIGTVTLPDTSPATNLYVLATLQNSPTPLSLFSAVGDSNGQFSLEGLPGGVYDISFVSGDNFAEANSVVVGDAGSVNLGTVQLQPDGRMFVRSGTRSQTSAGTNDDSKFPPGSTTPLSSALNLEVIRAQQMLRLVWMPIAYEGFGIEDSTIWNLYLGASSLGPNPKQFYGPGSQFVEGAMTPFGQGFRGYDAEDSGENNSVGNIQRVVQKDVQAMFGDLTLTCEGILEAGGTQVLQLNPQVFPSLIFNSPSQGPLNLLSGPMTYAGAFNIPSNTAGGTGAAAPFLTPGSGNGQEYEDNRHWEGTVTVTLAGDGQVTLNYNVDRIVNDTVDFNPGDLALEGPQRHFTIPMSFLETVGQAFDVPFQVRYFDDRFTQQTFTIPINPPDCPDPDRPPPPTTPGDDGTTPTLGSFDPNHLIGPAGFGPQGFISTQQIFPYTIQFENLSTATAAAQQVTVTDQLPSNLDWSTVQLGDIMFNGVTMTPPAGVSNFDATTTVATDPDHPVQIHVTFDPSNGLLTWTMTSIDPVTGTLTEDPLAGFLPPNNDEQQGEGSVSFTVRPLDSLQTGDTIQNQARIVFDINAPIDTNTVVNTIDAGAPDSAVDALPTVVTNTTFTVGWSGNDDTNGSGVSFFDVFVSDNGGPYTPFLVDTDATSAQFTGQSGHTYRFISVASDNIGNREPTPADPQATINVATPVPILTSRTFTDSDGDLYTIKVAGGGVFTAFLNDPDGDGRGSLHTLTATGTTILSSLSISVKKAKTGGGNGFLNVDTIQITGDLKSIKAPLVNLNGAGFSATGFIAALAIRDVLNGADLTAGGLPTLFTKFTAHEIGADSTITWGSAFKSIAAARIGRAAINAPSIGSISVKGDTKVIPALSGDFAADVTLSGVGVVLGKATLGKMSVAGTFSQGIVAVTGLLGGVTLNLVTTSNGNVEFGFQGNTIQSVRATTPVFAWDPLGPTDQFSGDFHVKLV